MVAARVAAAWAPDSPNITPISAPLNRKIRPVNPGGSRLSNQDEHRHDRGEDHRVRIGNHRRVHQHPHRDEEERDQQSGADELDALHQRPPVGHQAVERQPGEEGPDDRLDAEKLSQRCRREEAGEHEHEPEHGLLPEPGEEPLGHPRQHPDAVGGKDGQTEEQPEHHIETATRAREADHHP